MSQQKSSSLSISAFVLVVAGLSFWLAAYPVPEQHPSKAEHTVMAVTWYQTGAEFRALCFQAYNTAKLMLDLDLQNKSITQKRAVIVDIDETVLDNSPNAATQIRDNQAYPYKWNEWIDAAVAEPLPGALEFLQYAAAKGVDVYYISNRRANQVPATMKNLAKLGFPHVQEDRMLFRTTESSKEKRRGTVSNDHHIALLVGDNLNDFTDAFERKSVADRFKEVDRLKEEFGKRFIVLPNPIYGDWEGAIYDYNYRLSDQEKDQRRKSALRYQ